MINAKYTFDDKGIREITSGVSKLNATRLRVGIVGPNANDTTPTGGDLALWQLAAIQEFGSNDGHIPERSFIRRTLNDLVWLRTIAFRATQRVIMNGESSEQALNWMGRVVVTAMQNTIMQGNFQANTEATIEWKGHDHPLIGLTSALFNAVTHKVVMGGGLSEK